MDWIRMNKRTGGALVSVGLLAALALIGCLTGATAVNPARSYADRTPAPNHALQRMLLPGTQELQLIIELSSPSVVDLMLADRGRVALGAPGSEERPARLDLDSARARSYRARVAGEQRLLADKIALLPGARVEAQIDSVMSALILRLPAEGFYQVRRLPGVKKVYFSQPLRMLLDSSAPLVNAIRLWDKAGGREQAGKGIKIGIIDTGIDITNPMFGDDSRPALPGYPKGESEFTNRKVIVARNYIDLLPGRQTIHNALDEVGHGSFVAGVAAGNVVEAPLARISGMAPGASLGSYKVFGTPGINDFTTTAALLTAINDAVADGMDVLNLSLGSLNYLPPSEDPEILALQKAIGAGVTVVAAAGNEGPLAHTVENPGSTPDAITVGSVTNSRTFASHVRVTAPGPVPSGLGSIPYLPGDGPSIDASVPPAPVIDVARIDGTGQACGPLPSGSLRGSIGLVLRKPCTFASKIASAEAAGASAVIVYNNNPVEGPIRMSGLGSTTIPAVMISNADGIDLKQYIAGNPGGVLAGIDNRHMQAAAPVTSLILSSFSSVGPGSDLGVKPDLVAVGENVYSAAQAGNPNGVIYSPDGFFLGAGTSFSAPMIAGAAAGLKQLFPQLGALEIKSALVNTASQKVTVDGTSPPNVLQAGGGLLDMGAASQAGAVFTPSSLNFGARSYTGSLSVTKTVTIRNLTANTDRYSFRVQATVPGPTAFLSDDETESVPPGRSASVSLSLRVTAPQSGGFQGRLEIRSAGTGSLYRIPYWAGLYVSDRSRVLTVGQNAPVEGSFSSLTDALSAAQPGNIIEIADSGTYPAGLTINANAQGLPLDGITIRAAAGQTPTLDGSTVFSSPGNIRIIGLRNVLLQGLKISGGITGLLLTQSSTSAPLSVTIDHCTIDATSGAGIVAFSGASVDVTQSVISNSKGTGIVAIGGSLTLAGTTVQNNAADGIDALGVNLDILNSTVTANNGPGLNSVGSSGTIAESTFSMNRGKHGDGIEIVDGTLTIANCTFRSNERAGMAFFAGGGSGVGPAARVTGNVVQGNLECGVLAQAGQVLYLDGNLIRDNGCGFNSTGFAAAVLTNNIVLRSGDPAAGDGIRVAGNSNLRAVNNTVFKNAAHGILVVPPASASVFNTIISASGVNDVQGLTSGSLAFSLVGDGSASGNGNFSGDPRFADPSRDDLSLSPDSPAIGTGSNTAPNLPFLDFNRRLRVSSGLPAELIFAGTVDVGALEANSVVPLSFPLLANGDQPALGARVTTGLAVLNSGIKAVRAGFAGYGPSGALLAAGSGPASEPLDPDSQIARLGYQLFGFDSEASVIGSVLAGSTQPLAGFLLLFDSRFERFATGVSVSGETANDLIFLRHLSDEEGKADYVLFNPGASPAVVKATLFSALGSAQAVKTATISPKGQFLFEFDDELGSSGYARVASDRPVTGIELVGDPQSLTALPALSPGTEARLFFPHIALNRGFSTLIGIVNSAATPANLALTAYDDDGNVLGSPVLVTLEAKSQILKSAGGLFGLKTGALQTGYVIAQGDGPGIMGFTAFSYADGERTVTAALPADSVPRTHLLFSHLAHQVAAARGGTYQTGIGLLNPFGAPARYTLSVFDGTGAQVAQTTGILEPHQKIAKFLSHPVAGAGFFGQSMHLGGGHIEVTSDYGLFGLELFFTEDISQLAAVAAQFPQKGP